MELDFKAVKALSSPTRVKILRQVLEKESTPTQLSRDLDRSKSTISSHLAKLETAGLLEKDKVEGRKRVVYSPTRKAEDIVSGKERKVKFSITSSALSLLAGLAVTWRSLTDTVYQTADPAQMGVMSQEATRSSIDSLVNLSPDILLYIGLGMLSFSVLGFTYGWTIKKLTE